MGGGPIGLGLSKLKLHTLLRRSDQGYDDLPIA